MAFIIIVIHFILLLVSFVGIITDKTSPKYLEVIDKECPFFYYSSIIMFISAACYVFGLSIGDLNKNVIDLFFTPYTAFVCLVLTLIFRTIFSLFFYKEINNVSEVILKERPNFKKSAKLFIYSVSVFYSIIFINVTNFNWDRSKGELHTVCVLRSVYEVRGSGKAMSHHYLLYITPPIKNINVLEVDPSLQKNAKQGDLLELKVYNGFYGVRYIGDELKLIK